VNRRAFITVLGGAVAWPLAARAQQPAMPVIGYLSSFPADINPKFTQAFGQGLNDSAAQRVRRNILKMEEEAEAERPA
jgi:putative ABC transport system substrate-binding protein